jgi:hypothetical protein
MIAVEHQAWTKSAKCREPETLCLPRALTSGEPASSAPAARSAPSASPRRSTTGSRGIWGGMTEGQDPETRRRRPDVESWQSVLLGLLEPVQ